MNKDAIAIVGMSCRFPGAANLEEYWNMLMSGQDTISEVPSNRWDIDIFFDERIEEKGKMNTRFGGFIEDVDCFDAAFFGISPREAAAVSPQQRILLEESWNAFENASIPPESVAGENVGCFMGVASFDYYERLLEDPKKIDGFTLTGNAYSVTANRLSYALDLRGPSIAIDTACSSSLVAVHLACQSILNNECEMAIAGGTQVIVSPWVTVAASKGAFMAPDGRCKTFDERANGYVRGEGVGVLVLKKLSKAIEDKDAIHAIIRGSAVNQDGRSNGLSAPNLSAQVDVLTKAYQNAEIDTADVGYIEAHGTGTQLGDPIEIKALNRVIGANRERDNTCVVGSVKTNIGHLEAAAGIAGLIKATLCVKKGQIPPHLHFETPNPLIQFEQTPFKVPCNSVPWPNNNKRIAGVSSFGFGGTNSHVVIEGAQFNSSSHEHSQNHGEIVRSLEQFLIVTAKTPDALIGRAKSLLPLIENTKISLGDICASINHGLNHFKYRIGFSGSNRERLVRKIQRFILDAEKVSTNIPSPANRRQKLAIAFTGQGSQYPEMARELFNRNEIFRGIINRCDKRIQDVFGWSLIEAIYEKENTKLDIHSTAIAQPSILAVELGLFHVLVNNGVKVSAVLGHSLGEYSALAAAGVLTIEDAVELVGHRGKLMVSECSEKGAMLSVKSDAPSIASLVDKYAPTLNIAAFNSPQQTVISGNDDSIQKLCEDLSAKDIQYKKLKVSHAFHSQLMKPMLTSYENTIGKFMFKPAKLAIYSNVTGELIEGTTNWSKYLTKHIIAPVKFMQAIAAIENQGFKHICELGPLPHLSGLIQATSQNIRIISSLNNEGSNITQVRSMFHQLASAGFEIDWGLFCSPKDYSKVNLPGYPFKKQSFWMLDDISLEKNDTKHRHPFVSAAEISKSKQNTEIRIPVSTERFPYLADHSVYNADIVPSTFYIEVMQAVGRSILGLDFERLIDLKFRKPFVVGKQDRWLKVIVESTQQEVSQIFIGEDSLSVSDTQSHFATGKYQLKASKQVLENV